LFAVLLGWQTRRSTATISTKEREAHFEGVFAMAEVKNPSDTGGRLIAASKVNGTNVYNRAGEKLGSVYDVMIDKRSGNAEYAIMSFGGFLGIGDSYHPLPWRSLTYDERQGGYVVDVDRSRLEGAPSYRSSDTGRWADPSYGRQVDDYYGI
jgi:sporulation protein YlmC with PRC-barrel domain